jgi:predicted nucleic acid-binding protein
MTFVDTNIFIRYLTQDDPIKAAACLALFQRVQQGQEEVATSETVIAEIMYVLRSPRIGYRLQAAAIRARLRPVLALPGVRFAQKRACLRALDLAVDYPQLDFEDVLAVAHMEHAKLSELLSYVTGFDRVASITRHEP